MDERVTLTVEGGVATLTLARADKLNALDMGMIDALLAACERLELDERVRAVVLTGTGRAFCAGGDIDAWRSLAPHEFALHWLRRGHQAFDAIARLRQPVVAVLNGHALGGGLELAACADLRVAEAHARFGQPEPALGIVAGWSGTQRAVRRFGADVVRRMVLFGETFTAAEALALGLVERVVPVGEGLAVGRALAEAAAARGPLAVQMSKMMINAAEGEERERPLDTLAGGWAAHSQDLARGIEAFLARSEPRFEGR